MIWTMRIARVLQWALILAGLGALAVGSTSCFPGFAPRTG